MHLKRIGIEIEIDVIVTMMDIGVKTIIEEEIENEIIIIVTVIDVMIDDIDPVVRIEISAGLMIEAPEILVKIEMGRGVQEAQKGQVVEVIEMNH